MDNLFWYSRTFFRERQSAVTLIVVWTDRENCVCSLCIQSRPAEAEGVGIWGLNKTGSRPSKNRSFLYCFVFRLCPGNYFWTFLFPAFLKIVATPWSDILFFFFFFYESTILEHSWRKYRRSSSAENLGKEVKAMTQCEAIASRPLLRRPHLSYSRRRPGIPTPSLDEFHTL